LTHKTINALILQVLFNLLFYFWKEGFVQVGTACKTNFKGFLVASGVKIVLTKEAERKIETLASSYAQKRVSEIALDDFLSGIVSRRIIKTMLAFGFTTVKDIWLNSEEVISKVPSYGPVKDGRVQKEIDKYFQGLKKYYIRKIYNQF
jgi:hypothetical protein